MPVHKLQHVQQELVVLQDIIVHFPMHLLLFVLVVIIVQQEVTLLILVLKESIVHKEQHVLQLIIAQHQDLLP